MDLFFILIGLFFLTLVIGSILGWRAYFHAKFLLRENRAIRDELIDLRKKLSTTLGASEQADDKEPTPQQVTLEKISTEETEILQKETPIGESSNKGEPQPTEHKPGFVDHLKNHWMIWLGGISIGLAGIFLVKYSIDSNLLTPAARIALALVTGFGLHLFALRLHRLKGQSDIFAALAGGASLMLYAAFLAALHLYNLWPAAWAFGLLTLVSLATMALALLHGPLLAALGITGAYLVPVLVSTGSNNMSAALVYSFIISLSALLLLRYVYRPWLWAGTLAGAGFWWLVSLTDNNASEARLLYVLALSYTLLALATFDWRLRKPLQALKPVISLQNLFPNTTIKLPDAFFFEPLHKSFSFVTSLGLFHQPCQQ